MNPALAATSKMLKTVTALRFANRRTFSIAPDPTWLAKSKLIPTDRRQLMAIVGSYGDEPAITLERAMTTAPEALFTGRLAAFAESPLEWFDVLDQDDVVQFQLWLYGARAGTLFKASTTTAVAPIDDSRFCAAGFVDFELANDARGWRMSDHRDYGPSGSDAERPFEPVELTKDEFVIAGWLCEKHEINLDAPPAFLPAPSLLAGVEGPRAKGIVGADRSRPRVFGHITRTLVTAETPRGYFAGEHVSGTWIVGLRR
jgi:hypothetical protein